MGAERRTMHDHLREQWLSRAVHALRPMIAEKAGLNVPDVHVSTGFPSKNALSRKNQRIGECWPSTASSDGKPHVFISPVLATGIEVLHVLAHELLHSALPPRTGHKRPFAVAAQKIGLDGKPKATFAGEAFKEWQTPVLDQLGEYPTPRLNTDGGQEKKQTTRLVKCECDHCGYVIRTTQKWLDESGPPLCPIIKEPMTVV